jgi:hypothetical protein
MAASVVQDRQSFPPLTAQASNGHHRHSLPTSTPQRLHCPSFSTPKPVTEQSNALWCSRLMDIVEWNHILPTTQSLRCIKWVYLTAQSPAQPFRRAPVVLQAPVVALPELSEAPLHSSPVQVMWPLNRRNPVLAILENNFPHSSCLAEPIIIWIYCAHSFVDVPQPHHLRSIGSSLHCVHALFRRCHTKGYVTDSFEIYVGWPMSHRVIRSLNVIWWSISIVCGPHSIGHANQFSFVKPVQFSRKQKSCMLGLRCLYLFFWHETILSKYWQSVCAANKAIQRYWQRVCYK